jgi:hypothetical protein
LREEWSCIEARAWTTNGWVARTRRQPLWNQRSHGHARNRAWNSSEMYGYEIEYGKISFAAKLRFLRCAADLNHTCVVREPGDLGSGMPRATVGGRVRHQPRCSVDPQGPQPGLQDREVLEPHLRVVKVESPSTLYIEDFGLQCARNVGLSVEFIAPMILRSRAPIQHRHHRWLQSTAGNEVVQIKVEV